MPKIRVTATVLLFLSVNSVLWSQWNLPYARPTKYDYSSYYAPDLSDFIKSVPYGLKNEMKKAWTYFKSAFILSNGLVNHAKWDNKSQRRVDEDQAVSEGQGYGMLLAVLMNDQPTFNKIYNAANKHLWSGKSYKWNWKGGQGAATDGDLDIGLALIFADALVKEKLWQDNGGVKYSSRAKEIIQSIRGGMTSGDYLLPGDAWGGGIDKQNPSYYSLAAMKIFDDYAPGSNFSKVVDQCYNVLKKAPRYGVGQVPNWMTRNGGKTSPGNVSDGNPYGMGNDAIRTPWRIAMDALWFDDPRAKEYCGNTKKTLTAHNGEWGKYVSQLGFYDETGNPIDKTGGYPETTAMWACGILGSKDKSYSTKALRLAVITRITGSSSNYFGDNTMRDEHFYYKQAVSMLGFALVTGQFPNIWGDHKAGIIKPGGEGIRVTEALKSNKLRLSFPSIVTIRAKLSKATDWTITFTGLTSNITKSYNGNGSDVVINWAGEGFTKSGEMVEATLTGKEIDRSDPDQLKVKMYIITPWNSNMKYKTVVGEVTAVNYINTAASGLYINAAIKHRRLRITPGQGYFTFSNLALSHINGKKAVSLNKPEKAGENTWVLPGDNRLPMGLYLLSGDMRDVTGSVSKFKTAVLLK